MELRDNDRLDRWLDSSLQQYGSAEPRAGLEGRILANLAAQETSAARSRWGWVLLSGTAAAAVIAVLWMGSVWPGAGRKPAVRVSTGHAALHSQAVGDDGRGRPSLHTQYLGGRGTRARAEAGSEKSTSTRQSPRVRQTKMPFANKAPQEVAPRLDQFPSQRSLSEQEKLLTEYVTQFPDQAKLVAREQAESDKEMEQLYAENTHRSSQPER